MGSNWDPIHVRKESGASAQTSASGQSAQTWDPTSGHRRGSAAVSIVSQKRRKASLPEYFPTSSRYVLAKGLHQVHIRNINVIFYHKFLP